MKSSENSKKCSTLGLFGLCIKGQGNRVTTEMPWSKPLGVNVRRKASPQEWWWYLWVVTERCSERSCLLLGQALEFSDGKGSPVPFKERMVCGVQRSNQLSLYTRGLTAPSPADGTCRRDYTAHRPPPWSCLEEVEVWPIQGYRKCFTEIVGWPEIYRKVKVQSLEVGRREFLQGKTACAGHLWWEQGRRVWGMVEVNVPRTQRQRRA